MASQIHTACWERLDGVKALAAQSSAAGQEQGVGCQIRRIRWEKADVAMASIAKYFAGREQGVVYQNRRIHRGKAVVVMAWIVNYFAG